MNDIIWKALLAMDAYNRGYGEGITLPAEEGVTQIGNAIIFDQSDVDENTDGVNIGFYALAYTYNGQTIISYRGTDNPPSLQDPLPDDVYHGWSFGLGNIDSEQAQMAIEFYKAVAGEDNLQTANISLTGHSMGGGFAGAVAALYGQDAVVFDSMNYIPGLISIHNAVSDPQSSAYREDIKTLIYGASVPWVQNLANIASFHLEGEALGFVRLPTSAEIGLGADVSGIGAIDRHDMAALVIAMYGLAEVPSTDWHYAAGFLWPTLFDGQFAAQVGMHTVPGQLSEDASAPGGDVGKYAQILRQLIAYSAIDEGERVFGDTAIRALYNDANDLGAALSFEGVSQALSVHAVDISKVLVQFAGQRALARIEHDEGPGTILANARDGVLFLNDVGDGRNLTVNLNHALWSPLAAGIIPQSYLVKNILAQTGIESNIRAVMGDVWGDNAVGAFDRVVFALDGGDIAVSGSGFDNPLATLIVGSHESNHITGSEHDDLILGYGGQNVFYASAGRDIIVGAADGSDRVDYSAAASGIGVDFSADGRATVTGGWGDADYLFNIYDITGTSHNDIFHLSIPGGHIIDGGDGFDRVVYSGLSIVEDAYRGGVHDRLGTGFDRLIDIEQIDAFYTAYLPDHTIDYAYQYRDMVDYSAATGPVFYGG